MKIAPEFRDDRHMVAPSTYGPFPYSALPSRPRLFWPDGARVALFVVPNIECFALNERMPAGGGNIPDVSAWGIRDYGNRVGAFRMMDVMAKHGVLGTVALNSDCCDSCPAVVEAAMSLDWELMGHCESNTRRLSDAASEEDAREIIRRTLDRIEAFSGTRPRGWLGAGRQETWDTLNHLAAEGCIYTPDWDNDDQPVLMVAGDTPVVGIPYGAGVSDKQHFELRNGSAADFECIMRDAFDVLYEESADSGRVVALSLHPYIIGVPHRIRALDRAFEYIMSHDGVWSATGSGIVDWFLSQQAAKS